MSGLALDVLAQLAPLVQASDSDSPIWLLALGPAGAVGTYWAIYRYYRNHDKTHAYERDTLIEAQPVRGGERKVDHISKTRESGIRGNNKSQHRQRVQRF